MEEHNVVDEMDRSILRILSAHDCLAPLQLWCELGEHDALKEKMTEEEILRRLESLTARGFVERPPRAQADGDVDHSGYRAKPTGSIDGTESKR